MRLDPPRPWAEGWLALLAFVLALLCLAIGAYWGRCRTHHDCPAQSAARACMRSGSVAVAGCEELRSRDRQALEWHLSRQAQATEALTDRCWILTPSGADLPPK